MDTIITPEDLQHRLDDLRNSQMSIGLVPTMGYLHDGHLSLIRKAKSENDAVVTTIFVNPLQFSATEDLDTYPKDIESDTFLAKEAGTDFLFTPSHKEMFCDDVLTAVSVQEISSVLEGASRPTHFSGVATIVAKLFNIVGVCSAYFGEKDWQQIQVIKRMVKDLSYRVEIEGCPIVREEDGLAMSSRNVYLTEEQRKEAANIPESLLKAHQEIRAGERQSTIVKRIITERLDRSSAIEIDYVELVNGESLKITDQIDEQTRVLVAVKIGSARLIDNMNALKGLDR
ncbi:MAG: pantoate--beta-alanine ligase [Acidimicrobiaceae bacterium]|nr:pantoate--beta-alanine ligase [Acidimicrobiaceae bacterium]